MDNRYQPDHTGTDSGAQLEESLTFGLAQEDSLLGDALAENFIFGLEKLDLASEILVGGTCQQE